MLTLPSNTIPNLSLTGGTLELGADFQGGAITNLVLDGIILTNNTLPVTGTLIVSNNRPLYGSYLVAGGAVFDINHATLNAQVTVENGGQMQVYGLTLSSLGSPANPGNSNYWLSLQAAAIGRERRLFGFVCSHDQFRDVLHDQ